MSIVLRWSKRERKEKSSCPDFAVFVVEGTRHKLNKSIAVKLNVESDP